MSKVGYTVQRNVPATNGSGEDCMIALVLIQHENGVVQTVAINEDMIADMGEGVIEQEVRAACASPADSQFRKQIN